MRGMRIATGGFAALAMTEEGSLRGNPYLFAGKAGKFPIAFSGLACYNALCVQNRAHFKAYWDVAKR